MMNGGLSASDVALLSGSNNRGYNDGNGMWGDGGAWWIIILFLFVFCGWGNNGWGNNGGGQGGATPYATGAYTDAAIQRGFDNQSVMNKLNGIEQGICSLGYDQLAQMNGINQNVSQTGFAIQQAINADTVAGMQNTNAIQSTLCNMSAQQQACCCETQRLVERGFADTNYNMATQACDTRQAIQNSTRDILENNNSNTRAILDFLTNSELEKLRSENQTLKFSASQTAQNSYLAAMSEAQTAELIRRLGRDVPVPAYFVPNPNCCYNPTQLYGNSGCGYNSGCC